jgi:hypothetical protein
MIRRLFQFAVVVFVANALYQTAPVGIHYFEFKDALEELALFGQKSSDQEIIDRAMVLSAEHRIPLERDYVAVTRTTTEVVITASYLETMTFVPGFPYERQIDVEAKAYVVTEPTGR